MCVVGAVCVRVLVVQPENVRSIFGALTVVTTQLKSARISCVSVCVFVDVKASLPLHIGDKALTTIGKKKRKKTRKKKYKKCLTNK